MLLVILGTGLVVYVIIPLAVAVWFGDSAGWGAFIALVAATITWLFVSWRRRVRLEEAHARAQAAAEQARAEEHARAEKERARVEAKRDKMRPEMVRAAIAEANDARAAAQAHFAARAYSPFWTSVELAAKHLHYANRIRSEPVADLESARLALNALVATAQKDFHFAMIFEQRKANQLLVDSNARRDRALGALGKQLEDSLNDQGDAMEDTLEELTKISDRLRHTLGGWE